LENYWMGWKGSAHERDYRQDSEMGDLYGGGLLHNEAYRREFAAKIGVGFSLDAFADDQLRQLRQSEIEVSDAELSVVGSRD
jgi:hypothetical protein